MFIYVKSAGNRLFECAHILFKPQHGLITAGEKKRSIMKKLDEVREVLHNIYQGMEMNKINEAYLNSIRKEMDVVCFFVLIRYHLSSRVFLLSIFSKLCEMEKHLNKMYTEVDHEEQLLLSESSLAINGAFEKIKKDRQFMKLVSIIGAVVSSLITIIWVSYEQSKNKKILEDTITQLVDEKQKNESWGSYFKRNTRWIYGWAIPSK